MTIKDEGFRPLYHYVSAFELNDKLREIVKDCPDAAKASHAVFYGYIDPREGLMLELLGVGKQAPKYFYFKEPYEGQRITIKASSLSNVEFIYFPKLEPRFRKKYDSRIEALKQYDPDQDVEKTRDFGFLDSLRSPQFPDDVKVILRRKDLNSEEVWVHITGLRSFSLVGTLLNQPYQDYGLNKGDSLVFHISEVTDNQIVCYKDLTDFHDLTQEDLEDGSRLKQYIHEYLENIKDKDAISALFAVLRSSDVIVPCDIQLTDQAKAIMDRLKKEGKSLDSLEGEDEEIFRKGMSFIPAILEHEKDSFMPVFSKEKEFGENLKDYARVNMSFLDAIDMAQKLGHEITGITVNPYTDNYLLGRWDFDTVRKTEPLFEETEDADASENTHSFTEHGSMKLAVHVGKMDVFNFALYQNDVLPIRDIQILNETGNPVSGLSLKITSDFPFFEEYEAELPDIPSGKPINLPDPHLRINSSELADMTEAVNAVVTVALYNKNEEVVCGVRGQMKVLAYDQWQGGDSYRDLLAAFVMPNHPVIPALMHDAAEQLGKWNKPTSLEGYQFDDPNRVRDLAAAAYVAVQKKNIVYAEPPASFSIIGQRIRTPEKIMQQRLGTCMDMTLLYAAVLEAMGLDPLLVMLKGHIFAGLWLRQRSVEELKSGDVMIDDLRQLTRRIDNGTDEMTFVECTCMCSGKQVNFEESELIAKRENLQPDFFRFAVDVRLARIHRIIPIASRVNSDSGYHIEIQEKSDEQLTAAPASLHISLPERDDLPATHKTIGKKELWESKLLDLSQHNMLLNLPLNASLEPIMSSHIDELEDALADGHEFRLLAAPDWITGLAYVTEDKNGKKGKPVYWLKEAISKIGPFEITEWPVGDDLDINERFRQEFRSHRLYTFCGEKQLERELTSIYRAARSSQQENGVSSLYLAIGLMRWFAPGEKDPSYAPLVLLPVEIVRKSAGQGYALHARDEDPHFNTTLLEMLKQNFNLEIGGLDPLPVDEHGINIRKVFSIVRGALYSMKNWDVVESCAVGNFSFAQFAMWNDIHTAGDKLESSPIVRSLMKGYVDFDCSVPDDLSKEKVYLPITVDATQLRAIQMASHGTTFVLHGPPGTGKSQTITAMIANLMAQGKKVLFVAEKMAALSVVQKRLSALGLGDFCLELHSDKANKKHVLSQLEKAFWAKSARDLPDYSASVENMNIRKAKLDEYSDHLYQIHTCGYSLHELIDLYESVKDAPEQIDFDASQVCSISDEDVRRHPAVISGLIAAGSVITDDVRVRMNGFGIADYNVEVRNRLKSVTEAYRSALQKALGSAKEASVRIHCQAPESIGDLSNLANILNVFLRAKNTDQLLLDVLQLDQNAAEKYYQKKDVLNQKKQAVLENWKPELLSESPGYWRDRCHAAEKKFFGKSSAMAAVVSDLQQYAVRSISWEEIAPALERLEEYQSEEEAMNTFLHSCTDAQKELFTKLPEKADYEEKLESARLIQAQTEAFPGGLSAIAELAKTPDTAGILSGYMEAYEGFLHAEVDFNGLLKRDRDATNGKTIDQEVQLCDYLNQHSSAVKDWALYQQARNVCIETGLRPVVDAYESGMPAAQIQSACRKGLYLALIGSILESDDVLCTFSGATFNESVRQFKRLDDSLIQQSKQEIHHQICSRLPAPYESPEIGSEITLLMKAISSGARGMSIRALFDRIPNNLTRLAPCMLMSPNSVAQYLAQDNHLFDVVIFDEASQLPTCKAVGALMRAENAVIVGDPKQMPPTSFFAGGGPEIEDLALDDLDSILDDALALGIPSQYLQWHYRSRHESLIAFSNSEFYENQMFTFPSASERQRYVTEVYVEDGIYQKGINLKEAESVVEDIIKRYRDPKLRDQSIGVVTFNVKQQALIENLLAKQCEKDSDFDVWANSGEDPVFIKNLENVQGDERDVILFSIGYGPDEKGHLSMNFGPINKDGGGKRLNVAFSRARCEMRIFSSMHSSDLKVTESSPDGVKAFRDFLRFAEGHGLRPAADHASGDSGLRSESAGSVHHSDSGSPENGIRKSICESLRNHGYECETMIGHSDFRVDIAVINPYDKTQYLMGILLDGENYRRTTNTRDREIAQIAVLQNLDWNLRRIWTIDFWDNQQQVMQRLLDELNELKETARVQAEDAERQKAEEEQAEAARSADMEKLRNELETEAKQSAEDAEIEVNLQTTAVPEKDSSEKAAVMTDSDSVSETAMVSGSSDSSEKPVDKNSSAGSGKKEVSEQKIEPGEKSSSEATARSAAAPNAMNADETEHSRPATVRSSDTMSAYFAELVASGAQIIDKREHGGALWIVGGKSLQPIMKKFRSVGVPFIFKKGGGKATGGEDAWWSKTDVELPQMKDAQTIENGKVEDTEKETANSGQTAQSSIEPIQSAMDISSREQPAISSGEQVQTSSVYVLVEYRQANLEVASMGMADFISSANRTKLGEAAASIAEAEGPILKDVLYKKLFSLFGVGKTNDSVEAADKAIRTAKIKTSKLKGSIICWASEQDPKNYYGVRMNPDRHSDEIPLPELSNALCYVLQEKGSMDSDSLIKEASRVLGYKRLGKNLEAALSAGLQYAKSCKVIQIGKNSSCTLSVHA